MSNNDSTRLVGMAVGGIVGGVVANILIRKRGSALYRGPEGMFDDISLGLSNLYVLAVGVVGGAVLGCFAAEKFIKTS